MLVRLALFMGRPKDTSGEPLWSLGDRRTEQATWLA
jgi:hypothetical protein